MKPAAFSYRRAESIDHAVALLDEHADDDPKVLAGGQSLVAVMNLRLARPGVIIDISRIPGQRHITPQLDGGLSVGALTRHADFEHFPVSLGNFEVLRTASRHIGHVPIRLRGTVGGSVAHADPAAEWCLMAQLLDAEITAVSITGRRTIIADDLFEGFLTTSLEEGELITQVRFPHSPDRAGFAEFSRRHGDFAVVAAAVAHDVDDNGVTNPRVALAGVGARPVRCPGAQEAMMICDPADPAAAHVVARVAADEISPSSDGVVDAATRRHIATTMVVRALHDAGWATGATAGGDAGRKET